MSEHPYLQWPVFRRSIVAAFDRSLTVYFMWYNFDAVHQTLGVTPAMEASVSDHVWSVEEIVVLLGDLQLGRKARNVMEDGKIEILREGTWMYDGAVRCRANIARRDWDDEYYGDESGERPYLNAEGWQYYAEFESPANPGEFSQSARSLSFGETIALAGSIAPGLRWNDGSQ